MAPRASNIEKKIQAEEERRKRAKESKIKNFAIPESKADWYELSKRAKYDNIQSISSYCIASGSNTTDCQFLAYRAISDSLKKIDEFMEAKHVFGITDEIMKGSKEFPKYLALLEEETDSASLGENHQFWPGSWLSVKNYQENTRLCLLSLHRRLDRRGPQAIPKASGKSPIRG